jgi:hypothetical protein
MEEKHSKDELDTLSEVAATIQIACRSPEMCQKLADGFSEFYVLDPMTSNMDKT